MSKTSKILLGLIVAAIVFNCGADLAYAAGNADILNGGFGLSSIDSDLRRLLKGITALARPIVTIMTALAGMMVVLNIGGDYKQKIWNWILGIGLALNFGSVLWAMWGSSADISGGATAAAEYSFKVFNDSNLTDGTIDTLSQFMKYYLAIVVSGSLAIKPIAVKLLLGLALADMSVRLALDLTEKDKVSWLVKNFLKIGFYVWLINNWLGVDGLNLMDMLSKGFQQIGFTAGNYGDATLVSLEDINGTIDSKDNLAPDSIVTNFWKMFSKLYSSSVPQDATMLEKFWEYGKRIFNAVTSPISSVILCLSLLIGAIVAFLTAIEMFMARIEFYTLALIAIPMLAFGVVKHFEYLAQNAIRAVFNCGVKVCVISFLQAVICQMFTKYTGEVDKALSGEGTGNFFELISISLQLLLMSLIMYLIVSKIPKLIQGLLSGNPSMSGSDMTGTAMGAAVGAASTVGTVAGAKAAAVQAKAQGETGWKMSTMGQLGAAMLAKAPITGSAYGAYDAVHRLGWNAASGNQRQNQNANDDDTSKPQIKPAKGHGHRANHNNATSASNPKPSDIISKQGASSSPPAPANTNSSPSVSQGNNKGDSGSVPSKKEGQETSGSNQVPSATPTPVPKNNDNQNTNVATREKKSNPVPQNTPPKP